MQVYFHSRLCLDLPKVPILLEDIFLCAKTLKLKIPLKIEGRHSTMSQPLWMSEAVETLFVGQGEH